MAEGKNFEYIIYFLKKINFWQSKDSPKVIASALTTLINYSLNKKNFLFSFANPFKICILIIEMLNTLISKTLFNRSALVNVRNLYYNFSQFYLKKIQDESLLLEIMRDLDIEGRKLIYVIHENSLFELISYQNLQDVIDILWNGNVICNNNIFSFFSISQNLFLSKYNSLLQRKNKYFFVYNMEYQKQNYYTQKSVWKYNCRLKYFIDQLTVAIFGVLYFYYFIEIFQYKLKIYSNQLNNGYDPYDPDTYVNLTDQILVDEEIIIREMQTNFQHFLFINLFFAVNFPIKLICYYFYQKYKENVFKFYYEDIISIILSVLFTANIIVIYFLLDIYEPNRALIMGVIDFASIALMSAKIIMCTDVSKIFGVLLKALYFIILDSLKFTIIYSLVVLVFTFIAHFLLYDMQAVNFQSLSATLYHLIQIMFNQYSFLDFQYEQTILGPLFYIIYVIHIPIFLFNVLVAILTQTFERSTKQGIFLYYQKLIDSIRKLEYNSKIGCLVSIPIVLNPVNLAFILFYLVKGRNDPSMLKKVNHFMMWIGYSFIMVLSLFGLILLNLLLLPFAIVTNFFFMFYYLFRKRTDMKKFALWTFCGIFLIFFSMFKETYKLCLYMISDKGKLKESLKGISKENYILLRRVFLKFYKQGKEIINLSDVIFYIKDHHQDLEKKIKEGCEFSDDSDELEDLDLENIDKIQDRLYMANKKLNVKDEEIMEYDTSILALRKGNSLVLGGGALRKIDKINIKDLLENTIDSLDAENLYDFLEKLIIKSKELDFELEDKSDYMINIKNALKLMKYYGKKELKLTHYHTLYICLVEFHKTVYQ